MDAGFKKQIPLQHEYMKTFIDYELDFGGANRVLVAVMAFRWWKNRQNGAGSASSGMGAQPAFAGFGGASAFGSAPAGPTATTAANPLASQFTAAPHLPGVGNPQLGNLAGPSSAVTSWTIPAGFDTGDFLQIPYFAKWLGGTANRFADEARQAHAGERGFALLFYTE